MVYHGFGKQKVLDRKWQNMHTVIEVGILITKAANFGARTLPCQSQRAWHCSFRRLRCWAWVKDVKNTNNILNSLSWGWNDFKSLCTTGGSRPCKNSTPSHTWSHVTRQTGAVYAQGGIHLSQSQQFVCPGDIHKVTMHELALRWHCCYCCCCCCRCRRVFFVVVFLWLSMSSLMVLLLLPPCFVATVSLSGFPCGADWAWDKYLRLCIYALKMPIPISCCTRSPKMTSAWIAILDRVAKVSGVFASAIQIVAGRAKHRGFRLNYATSEDEKANLNLKSARCLKPWMVLWPFIYNFRLQIKDLYRICINLCTVRTSVSPVASPAHLDPCLAEALIKRSLGHEPWAMKARDVTNSSIPAKQNQTQNNWPIRTDWNQPSSPLRDQAIPKPERQTADYRPSLDICHRCIMPVFIDVRAHFPNSLPSFPTVREQLTNQREDARMGQTSSDFQKTVEDSLW